jgi:hypothetical protein
VGSSLSCTEDNQAAAVTRGEARADKENDINKILASPAFRFANSRIP